jgi:hypothetical protein
MQEKKNDSTAKSWTTTTMKEMTMMMKEMTMMMKKIAHELMPVTNVVVGVTDRRMFDEEGQHRRPPYRIVMMFVVIVSFWDTF